MTLAARALSPTRLGPRARLFLARRPWVRWLIVVGIAAVAALAVHAQMEALEAARASWSDPVRVPIALEPSNPGDPLAWEWREVPAAVVPDAVATSTPDDAIARSSIGRGEIVTVGDLTMGSGPAAGADPGEVVVPVRDALVVRPDVGLDVAVYSDGLVLAQAARIVQVDEEVVFVAVAADAAPVVAAAAQTDQASIVFLGPR